MTTDAIQLLLFLLAGAIALLACHGIIKVICAFRDWRQVHGYWGR